MEKHRLEDIIEQHRGANVLILGNGPTGQHDMKDYWKVSGGHIWTVNGAWGTHHPYSNLGWMMDDWDSVAHDQDINSREQKADLLRTTQIPVMHPREVLGFDCFVRYPLEDIIATFNMPYFGETFSYAVAFAIFCRVRSLHFFGCDYFDCKPAERACTEGWAFLAKAYGIEVHVVPQSHFMRTGVDGINNHIEYFYGYTEASFPFRYEYREGDTVMLVPKGDG